MILHVDMDAFYASVEQRDRPELRGRPVIVGGTPEGRGVVAAASYEARQFGIHSAMPAITARRLCPQAVCLPVRMRHYAAISAQIREIFQRYTPTIEPLSLDEAFLDVAGTEKLFGSACDVARQIQTTIREELNLAASVGVAPNKFVAKIASDLRKPQGFVYVPPDGVAAFLEPLGIERLWGVGKVSQQVLHKLGVRTIGQLRQMDVSILRDHFGKQGDHLWDLAHGRDERRVVPDHLAKSISHETTFAQDVGDFDVLRACLLDLTEQVARRLRRQKLSGRTIQLKIRFANFRTITRANTLPVPTNVTQTLWETAAELLASNLSAATPPVRLLGMGVSGFDNRGPQQGSLFADKDTERHSRLDVVRDAIREKFGESALGRGARLTDQENASGGPSE
ncbi:DNA polymerase IV [Symmachiella macrocystis]|uniref:DNA polymerase IV n=1 Tax=Symmachiella macrocystis TaxID=2527985 RepID=A0A5C6BTY0_9PLAN|nr:DNA polymerase IV [Symmachiella macrocystis]TWU14636.1 DNA polymerase IV [Symmachiella macrocystis]